MMAAITAVGVAVLQVMFSRYTVLGLTVRAVGSDAELSTAMGVSTTRMRVTAAGAGGAIAGLAGVLLGMQSGLMPTMGLHLFLMGLIVAIIGGAHTLVGICLAASLLGMAEHWGAWWLSSQWQGTIAFLILMFFMVLRPKGLVAGWTQGRSV